MIDPRGLIFESYRMEGISAADCRSIFLDWALGVPEGENMHAALLALRDEYCIDTPDHPMSKIIQQGLGDATPRKSRRAGRAAKR